MLWLALRLSCAFVFCLLAPGILFNMLPQFVHFAVAICVGLLFACLFRAKFDLNTNPMDDDMHLRIRAMSLDLSSPSHIPLNVRMAEFSEDPQNMDQMKEFIDGILNEAQTEVTNRLDEQNKVRGSFFHTLLADSRNNQCSICVCVFFLDGEP